MNRGEEDDTDRPPDINYKIEGKVVHRNQAKQTINQDSTWTRTRDAGRQKRRLYK